MQTTRLSNLQLELIKVFSYQVPDKQLLEIRDILTTYFADTLSKEMDKLWDENNWTDETMESWLNEDLRTSYQPK
jgi:hypothetical protein